MTREELFRAVGEVREDQIEAAALVRRQIHPWRRFAALAACLALVVTAAAVPQIKDQFEWKSIVKSFNPAVDADSGGGAAAGGLDGSDYWTDNPVRPTHPGYSSGVEIGQLSGPGNGDTMVGMSACLVWLSPEEIFAQNTAIFRGTVRELHYFIVEPGAGGMELYYTRAVVEVTDSIRGNLTAGETCSLLWLGAKGYMSTSIAGALEDLDVGGEAIFMPVRTDRDTGWKEGNSYFCYADLADFYLSEGSRYVFADTADGLTFDRGTYEEIADAETLDVAAAYIREQIGEEESEGGQRYFITDSEGTQPAAVPAEPQTEPSETRQANPEELDPSYFPDGPNGARELPGGAYAGE